MIPKPVIPLDPGPLIDRELRLVAPSLRWLDGLMASLAHPLTEREMPSLSRTTRDQVANFISKVNDFGFDPGEWDAGLVPAYHFWMIRTNAEVEEPQVVGGLNLRVAEGPNIERVIGHIGYHVYPPGRGHRYAERACRLLLPLAQRHGINPVWITCNPENTPSRRTIERLGGVLTEIVPVPVEHPLFAIGETVKCLYRVGG